MNKHLITRPLVSALALVTLASSCGGGAKAQADKALKDAGVEVPESGKLPSGFPTDVPTPDLKLENGVGAAGNFTLRYTSSDAKGDITKYRDKLVAAGFTVANESDDLAGTGKNAVVMATKGTMTVAASAFAPDAPGGGNYMGVVVTGTP